MAHGLEGAVNSGCEGANGDVWEVRAITLDACVMTAKPGMQCSGGIPSEKPPELRKGIARRARLRGAPPDSLHARREEVEAHPTVVTSFAGVAWFVGGGRSPELGFRTVRVCVLGERERARGRERAPRGNRGRP